MKTPDILFSAAAEKTVRAGFPSCKKPVLQFVTANASDADVIAHLRQKIWATTYRGIYPDDMIDAFDYDWHIKKDLQRIQNLNYAVYLIQADHQNVGYITLCKGEPFQLMSLYVLSSMQNQGIGTQAFAFVRDYCAAHGIHTFICDCHPDNTNALTFYKKMGGMVIDCDTENEAHWQDSVIFSFSVDGCF